MVHSGCSVSKLTITHILIEGFCSGWFLSFSLRPASSIVAIHVLFYTSRHTLDLSTTVVNSSFFRIFGPERRVHICSAEVECMTRGREKGFFHLAIISGHEGTWDCVMHSDYTICIGPLLCVGFLLVAGSTLESSAFHHGHNSYSRLRWSSMQYADIISVPLP